MAQLIVINERIKKLGNAERVTKAELSALSRELLEYVMLDGGKGEASFDIDAVNRTLAVLTPVNKRAACLYFPEFLPFAFDADNARFGKMKKKGKEKAIEAIKEWLADDTNDIWKWAADNVKMEKKPPEYAKQLTKIVERALADEADGLTVHEVLMAVLSADGINVADVVVEMEQARLNMDNQGVDNDQE
jgi:uncharacterized protein YfeS